ncbi:MAG: VOC family protein [Marinosulfonomonas sp.]|nr:VOC family protein [Marinosulfonomonas sp.]
MSQGILEHVNFTVSDPKATAAMLCDLFGWHIRWQGAAKDNGYTVHVGSGSDYLAIYSGPGDTPKPWQDSYSQLGGLNHVGIIVDDLNAVEARVKAAGYEPINHADYEPGRRFYFRDGDNIEYEIVSYA